MRTVSPMEQLEPFRGARLLGPQAPTPPAPADRRTLSEEVVVVLLLSLLASAVYAILSLLEAPLAGTIVASANQSTQLARQLAGFVFGLPVGMSFFGRAWTEMALIRIAYAYEQATKHRRPPRFLATADLSGSLEAPRSSLPGAHP